MKDAISKIENITFGCEFEYEGIGTKKAAKVIAETVGGTVAFDGSGWHSGWVVTMPDGRKWNCITDGSLHGESSESVSPVCTYRDIEMVQRVVRALRRAGAIANERTGLHIHVGAKDMTPVQIKNLTRIFYKQEDLILKAAGTQARRIARYTRRMSHAFLDNMEELKGANLTMDGLNAAWYGTYTPRAYHYNDSRYRALNLCNLWRDSHGAAKGTVEFRFFEATTHAGKVRANVLLALTLVAFAKEAKTASAKHKRDAETSSSKYDFRVFLLRLGWIGETFKEPRKHLMANLAGSAAWKNGRAAA